jgi:hypothetical protein
MAGRRRVARQEVVGTVDSDQDRLMVAFNTVPARLWVGGDPNGACTPSPRGWR